ncbi:ArsR/SmtB family transcription factor [Actinoplanes sp. NPDC049265]|uniref:ArsR/SmtB family transcription factor n=1 Tax=Actinoplanes sp. NPDC049265 TaxID=3363902 RepID=UPI003714489F
MEERSVEERLADLEQKVAALTAEPPATPAPGRHEQDFWALEGLRGQIGDLEGGAVLFTGIVQLPTDERYEWQYGLPVERLMAEDWSDPARTLAALGHPVRLTLLRRVLEGVRNPAELAEQEGLGTTGQIYHHLRQLVNAGWLRSSARGVYEVPGERVIPLLVLVAGAWR